MGRQPLFKTLVWNNSCVRLSESNCIELKMFNLLLELWFLIVGEFVFHTPRVIVS